MIPFELTQQQRIAFEHSLSVTLEQQRHLNIAASPEQLLQTHPRQQLIHQNQQNAVFLQIIARENEKRKQSMKLAQKFIDDSEKQKGVIGIISFMEQQRKKKMNLKRKFGEVQLCQQDQLVSTGKKSLVPSNYNEPSADTVSVQHPLSHASSVATSVSTDSESSDVTTATVLPKHSRNSINEVEAITNCLAQEQQPCTNIGTNLSSSTQKKDNRWLATLEDLREYKKKHGNCIVPRGYTPNPRLASWVAEQRKQYKLFKDGKQSSITPERVALLNALEFAWNAQEAAWHRHMSNLKEFCKVHGHCHVPLSFPAYPKLGLWVKEQRRHYALLKQGKQSHMTRARSRELDSVGFCWDTHEAMWLERLRELTQFKEDYGHSNVPTNYPDNTKLGTWVHHQRRQYKKYKEGKSCHITAQRIRALDSLGFLWHPREKQINRTTAIGAVATTFVCKSNARMLESNKYVDPEKTDLSSLDLRPRKRQRNL